MTWIKSIWHKIVNLWKRDDTKPESPVEEISLYRLISMENQLPYENVEERTVYHIGTENWKWLLMFKCPCGCADVIHLSLLHKSPQHWTVKSDNETFSIYPSINRKIGCKSHFFIKDGDVVWCYDICEN
jgi:hypothetical protein